MEDDPIVISSGLVITPEVVAARSFGTAFRGYNPDEVRAFLKRVADELVSLSGRQGEMRHALQEALARAAHPEVDESVLTTALGEHAARLIGSAREQAASITSEAEERAARLLRDAEEKVARMRKEADGLMARRVEEAETVTARIREAAESDAASLRDQARTDADQELQSAQARGREMVVEAKAVRERMLGDLARRRRAAEVQIEQLRAGRDRLAEAYETVRRTLAEVTHELDTAEPEARMAADAVGRRAVETQIPERPGLRPDLHLDLASALGVTESSEAATPSGGRIRSSLVTAFAPRPRDAAEFSRQSVSPTGTGAPSPAGSLIEGPFERGASPKLDLSGPGVGIVAPSRRPQTVAEVTDVPPASELATGEIPAVRSGSARPDAIEAPAELDDLFARIRADREQKRSQAAGGGESEPEQRGSQSDASEAAGSGPQSQSPMETKRGEPEGGAGGPRMVNGWASLDDPVPSGPVSASGDDRVPAAAPAPAEPIAVAAVGDEATLQKRDEAIDSVEADLARRLKRVLQDEQNEVLDALRRQRTPAPLTALIEVGAQRARYREASTPTLELAAAAGATFGVATGAVTGSPHRGVKQAAAEAAADLAADLVMGLRERLELSISENDSAQADTDQFTESISSTYRQWKLQEIEPLARHYSHAAFVQGAFAAVAEGSALRWVVDDETPCPDCDDNALAGPTPKGEEFPTGQSHPPAHPGCRCVLVPALP